MNRKYLIALIILLALVAAFVASFVIGLREDAPVAAPTRERDIPTVNSGRRVEVYNSSGRAGLARDATQLLRDAGFDVVMIGNAGSGADSSRVIDRIGRLPLAQSVGRTLGITQVVTEVDSSRLVEVSVYLGSDWKVPR